VAETNLVCFTAEVDAELLDNPADHDDESPPSRQRSPPPQYPASEASGTSAFRPPPSFSSLFPAQDHDASGSALEPCEAYNKPAVGETTNDTASASSAAAPAYAPPDDQVAPESSNSASAALRLQDETKRALPRDTKSQAGEPSRSSAKDEEAEPPPAYSEGSSPLHSFTYLMAAAGGAASIITQVQQGGPSLNPLGGRSWPWRSWES
jgi:G patch domain-containing protein 1